MIEFLRLLRPALLSAVLGPFSFAFGQEIKFAHLTTDDGLFSGNVRAFLQDYQGFMWIGTDDGLYRYDGYEMVAFKNEKNNPSSLSDNFILAIFEDSNGNLWFGTFSGGLSFYDRQKNRFRNYKHDPDDPSSLGGNSVRVIYEDDSKNLYVGSDQLSRLNLNKRNHFDSITFQNLPIPRGNDSSKENWVSAITQSQNGNLLVGTRHSGVLLLDPKNPGRGLIPSPMVDDAVESLFVDSKGRIWVGTWEKGVSVYDSTFSARAQFTASDTPGSIKHNLITHILEDNEGNIWMATDNGLARFDHNQNPFVLRTVTTFNHDNRNSYSLLGNAIKALYFDRQNRMWVGSYSGGISVYDPNLPRFNSYRPNILDPGELKNGNVWALALDKKKQLWIGTDGGGLYVLPPREEKYVFKAFESVPLVNPSTGGREDKIKCMTLDEAGNLWVGTWAGGVFRLDPETKTYVHFDLSTNEKEELVSRDILSIQADGNNVWIGNFMGGLSYYDAGTDRFKTFTRGRKGGIERINDILLTDEPGTVMTAQEQGGVNTYSADHGYRSTLLHDAISGEQSVGTLYRDRDGSLWIGSNISGLISFDPVTKHAEIYDSEDGLVNYWINAIIEDNVGNLWMSTNQGLFKFDKVKEQFTHFTRLDGLQGNQYNPGSSITLPDGMMIFGGTNGFDYFYGDEIQISHAFPEIVFTGFWLGDEEIERFDSLSPLRENITVSEKIELKHTQNSFSIEFAGIDFTQSQHIEYQFIVEGLHDRWQQLGYARKVSFTDLKPGEYSLKVRSSNREKLWSDNFKEIVIIIHPAWWQTNWFATVLILGLIGAALAIHRIRLGYLVAQKKNLEIIVRERTNEISRINDEVLAQNAELASQNEKINAQRSQLEETQRKLRLLNEHLEELVNERTSTLKQTIQERDRTLKELDRFVYSAYHELGAPIKSVRGLLNLAKLESDPENLRNYLSHIELCISKLEQVIRNLSDHSKNSNFEVINETFDFNSFVTDVVAEFKLWPEAQKVLINNLVPVRYMINTDANRMRMILYNLVSNGIRYADHSKSDSLVEIKCSKENGATTIDISDNGIGIDPNRQARIFDMFYRASEQSNGSGLGLFIVKKTLETINGKITVRSKPGVGTTFTIALNQN